MEFIEAKTLLSNSGTGHWFGIDYNMNIYRGCCHGCIYCDSRSDCYHIENFDKVRAKKDAAGILHRELSGRKRTGVIGMGAMSDPYNPFEREYCLTRKVLETIYEHGFGVAIATKSSLVTRDIDILKEISRYAPVIIKITVTTSDDSLCKQLEPFAPLSSERFEALKELNDNKIFSGILMTPVLPFIEDTHENIMAIIKQGKESGIQFLYPQIGVTLRQNQREYYFSELNKLFPHMTYKYIETFGNEYVCRSPHWKELYELVAAECSQRNILYRMNKITEAYKAPTQNKQYHLFDIP